MNLIFRIPPRRDLAGVTEPGCVTRAPSLCCALACHNFFGGNSDARTATSDNRIAATENATVQSGSSTSAKDSAIVVRDASKIQAPGALDNTGGTITVQGVSADEFKAALQSVSDVTNQATSAAQSGQSQLSSVLSSAVTSLAAVKKAEAVDAKNNQLIWVLLALFALMAFLFRKVRL